METNRIVKNSLIIGGLLAATTALVIYFKRQFELLKNSCYTISGGVVHSLSLDVVKITLFFKVVNKSDITVHIKNLDFNISVNNLPITKITRKEKQTILSNSDIIILLNFEFNPQELLKAGLANIAPLLTDKNKLLIRITGTYDAETGIIVSKKIPFDESITLAELLKPTPNTKKC